MLKENRAACEQLTETWKQQRKLWAHSLKSPLNWTFNELGVAAFIVYSMLLWDQYKDIQEEKSIWCIF
jgi:hypothetical protein